MDFIALALTLAGFSVMLILISYQRHRHGRDLSAWLHGIVGALVGIVGALAFETALNLSTYQEAPDSNVPLAELSVTRHQAMFQVSLMRIPSGELQVFTLPDATWRLQVRLLRGRGLLTRLGLQPQWRLEQLHSLSALGAGASVAPVHRYTLSHDSGLHLAALSHNVLARWLFSTVITSTPMAFEHDNRYQVFQQDGRLIIRSIGLSRAASLRQPPVAPSLNHKAISLLQGSDLALPETPVDGPEPGAVGTAPGGAASGD